MGRKEAEEHLKRLDGWSIKGKLITKEFRFKDFVETMKFVNKVADLAEAEGHHPDMLVSYGKVAIELWTHAVGGLSKNDFVLAAKIDRIKV
jgi:4a-hydroxytetrahydrobiopterin dehydratase